MADAISIQELIDARTDAKTLEEAVNGDAVTTVLSRLGETYPTLSNALNQIDSKLDSADTQIKQGITNLFENGGLPATPFATKALMTASAVVDGDYAMVTDDTANNGLYVKTAGVWVKSDYDPFGKSRQYTDDVVVSKGLHGLLSRSYNLFNPLNLTYGYSINIGGGLDENADYALSEFIEVEPNTAYLAYSSLYDAFTYTVFYDKDKQFISRVAMRNKSEPSKTAYITTPANARYVRHSNNEATSPSDKVDKMFAKGDSVLPFVSGKWKIEGATLGESAKQDILTEVEESVDSKGFAKQSLPDGNLLNPTTATLGKVILATGEIVDNAGYAITDYIPISADMSYMLSGVITTPNLPFNNASYYTADKVFLARDNFLSGQYTAAENGVRFLKITPRPLSAYVRFNINTDAASVGGGQRMINVGDTLTDYVDGTPKLLATLSDEAFKQLADRNNIKGGASYLESVKDWYKGNETLFGGFQDWKSKTSAQVHQMWSDLQAQYPHAIDKKTIGNDFLGNPMYLYTVSPDKPAPTEYAPKTKKIYLACSIHGYEKVPSLATYLMLREMLKRDAPKELQALRANCTLLIVPIANPSGWDLDTRKSANGVDLNRNFEQGWSLNSDPSASTYGGTAPLSEPEAVNLNQVFLDNPDIDAFYDFHNFFSRSDEFVWIPTTSPPTLEIAQPYLSRITRQWRADFDWIPDEPWHVGVAENYSDFGMIQAQARKHGIKYTATFEVCEKWALNSGITPFGATHCKTSVEAIANWLLINLDFLSRE